MVQSKTARLSVGKKQDRSAMDVNVLSKYNYSNGAGWRTARDRKIANRGKGQTSGKTKGDTCHASAFDRHCAKSSRAYKHRDYGNWMVKTRYTQGGQR